MFSISDDRRILRWNTKTKNYKVDVFKKFKATPTTIDWLISTRGQNYLLAVGFDDGSLKFITHTGVEEKHVSKAHKGAVSLKFLVCNLSRLFRLGGEVMDLHLLPLEKMVVSRFGARVDSQGALWLRKRHQFTLWFGAHVETRYSTAADRRSTSSMFRQELRDYPGRPMMG